MRRESGTQAFDLPFPMYLSDLLPRFRGNSMMDISEMVRDSDIATM